MVELKIPPCGIQVLYVRGDLDKCGGKNWRTGDAIMVASAAYPEVLVAIFIVCGVNQPLTRHLAGHNC